MLLHSNWFASFHIHVPYGQKFSRDPISIERPSAKILFVDGHSRIENVRLGFYFSDLISCFSSQPRKPQKLDPLKVSSFTVIHNDSSREVLKAIQLLQPGLIIDGLCIHVYKPSSVIVSVLFLGPISVSWKSHSRVSHKEFVRDTATRSVVCRVYYSIEW